MWPALAAAARAHGIATSTLASVRLSNRRLVSPRFAAASASAARSNSNSSSADQITDDELKGASVAVRLASHVYKVGDIEPWVRREGFTLMAEGETNCTRWYVCDKRAGEATTHRWVIVRGAAWNNEKVDRVRLSTQIGKAWPSPLHEEKGAPPVVVHTGVKEMADEFWPDVSPWITSTPNGAQLCFAGHSLGGSMAMLLMAWSKLRLGVDPRAMDPCWTFGSPPVLASDGWEMRKRRGADVTESVARAAADGGDWVGELMRGVGMGNATGGVTAFGADAGEGLGASTPSGSTETGSTPRVRLGMTRFAWRVSNRIPFARLSSPTTLCRGCGSRRTRSARGPPQNGAVASLMSAGGGSSAGVCCPGDGFCTRRRCLVLDAVGPGGREPR